VSTIQRVATPSQLLKRSIRPRTRRNFRLAGLAGIGLAWSLVITSVIAVLQSADPRMLGRVMSLFALVLLGSASAGGPIASFVASSMESRAPFVLGAGAAIAATIITSANRRAGLSGANR
jgi:MFS family permease